MFFSNWFTKLDLTIQKLVMSKFLSCTRMFWSQNIVSWIIKFRTTPHSLDRNVPYPCCLQEFLALCREPLSILKCLWIGVRPQSLNIFTSVAAVRTVVILREKACNKTCWESSSFPPAFLYKWDLKQNLPVIGIFFQNPWWKFTFDYFCSFKNCLMFFMVLIHFIQES